MSEGIQNKELREFLEVLHEALATFVRDPQRNRRALVRVLRHIEQRTDVKPFVDVDLKK